MAREKTWQFDMNRAYLPANQLTTDFQKYIIWYYKAFITGQIGANWSVLATVLTAATPGAAGTLANGTYYYQVTALNGGNESVASNELAAVVSAGGTGSVALTWTAVAGATGYRVYRGTAAAGENVYYLPGNVTTYTDTNDASTGGTPPTLGSWVLLGSSDATTAGMDGMDRWAGSFNAGKINRNTAGSAHSWVVLRGPVMNTKTYYLLIDYSTSVNYALTVVFGHTTAPTGGTVNNAPTMQNLATLTSQSFCTAETNMAVTASAKVHGALATDGSFNILTSRDFSMKFLSGFLFHLLGDFKATDPYPVWMHLAAENAAQTPGSGWAAAVGTADAKTLDYSVNAAMRMPDNSNFAGYGLILPALTNTPNTADAFDGSFVDWPVMVGFKGANNNTIRGRLQDVYYFPYTFGANVPNQGSVDDLVTPLYMLAGLYWFPTNAVPQIY